MARLNFLLMPLALGTGYILKALLVLILIGAVGLRFITAQVRLDGLELSGLSH